MIAVSKRTYMDRRRLNVALYLVALLAFCSSATFAFVLPQLGSQARHWTPRPRYSVAALNVSQLLISPEAKPALNHRERCAELPWVNESGTA